MNYRCKDFLFVCFWLHDRLLADQSCFVFISLFIWSDSFFQILQVSIIYFGFVWLVRHPRHAEAALLPPKPDLLRWMCVLTLVPRTVPVVPLTCSDRCVFSSGIVSCSLFSGNPDAFQMCLSVFLSFGTMLLLNRLSCFIKTGQPVSWPSFLYLWPS